MTSFSPARARSCNFGIVTRTALSDCCTLMVASSPVEELAPPAHRVDALDEEVEVVRHVDEVQAVELVLGIVEGEARKKRILPEREIGDRGLGEEVGLLQPLELRHALEE